MTKRHHPHYPLTCPAKAIRARAIHAYVRQAGLGRVVCFSCGNAAAALRATGLDVLEIGPKGPLHPGIWWQPCEIARYFADRFDATSGHLPVHLMQTIGSDLRAHLGDLPTDREIHVPTGSGETLCCLAIAYPECRFVAVYDQADPATSWHDRAPLNALVERLAAGVIYVNPNLDGLAVSPGVAAVEGES